MLEQLENMTDSNSSIQSQGIKQKEPIYTAINLESMSASALYSADACDKIALSRLNNQNVNRANGSPRLSLFSPLNESSEHEFKIMMETQKSISRMNKIIEGGAATYGGYNPSNNNETIRPMGQTQLHIHEGAGGSANISMKPLTGRPINSYEAAMMDLQFDCAGVKRIIKKDNQIRRGRI